MHVHTHVYIRAHVYIHTHVHIHTDASTRAGAAIIPQFMCEFGHMHIHTHVYIGAHVYIHTHVYIHADASSRAGAIIPQFRREFDHAVVRRIECCNTLRHVQPHTAIPIIIEGHETAFNGF